VYLQVETKEGGNGCLSLHRVIYLSHELFAWLSWAIPHALHLWHVLQLCFKAVFLFISWSCFKAIFLFIPPFLMLSPLADKHQH
jgi:hypothetical protein